MERESSALDDAQGESRSTRILQRCITLLDYERPDAAKALIDMLDGGLPSCTASVGLAEEIAWRLAQHFTEGSYQHIVVAQAYWSLFPRAKTTGDLQLATKIADRAYGMFPAGSQQRMTAASEYWALFPLARAERELNLGVEIAFWAYAKFAGNEMQQWKVALAHWSMFEPAIASGQLELASKIARAAYWRLRFDRAIQEVVTAKLWNLCSQSLASGRIGIAAEISEFVALHSSPSSDRARLAASLGHSARLVLGKELHDSHCFSVILPGQPHGNARTRDAEAIIPTSSSVASQIGTSFGE